MFGMCLHFSNVNKLVQFAGIAPLKLSSAGKIVRYAKNLDVHKDKEMVYRILAVLYNLPKAMHGCNILNNGSNLISYKDALSYAKGYMDEKMEKEYQSYFQ